MRPFRRRKVTDGPPVISIARPPVEFMGVAPGEADLAAFPYEFLTDADVPVRLHDMQFLGVDHHAPTAELTLRFVYDDPECTPAKARDTPVAVFRFEEVLVQQWEDLDAPGPDPNRVCAMSYDEPRRLIGLSTGRTHLVVTGRRMSVSMEPRQ